MSLRNSSTWKRGRIGEILQFGFYQSVGVELEDLSDRTSARAPFLYGRTGKIISPDANAIRSARFFIEFKTKTHHHNGTEEGINDYSLEHYRAAQRRWRQPVVLSILSIQDGDLIAAPLDQLGEPRPSRDPDNFPLVNWRVRKFSRIARFSPRHLSTLFNGDGKAAALRERWLAQMPEAVEIDKILDWLRAEQLEFDALREFIFDQTERDWAKTA
jgi:hypothetical protein